MLLFLELMSLVSLLFHRLLFFDVNTLDILKTFCVYSGGSSLVAIKSIEVARRGSNFLMAQTGFYESTIMRTLRKNLRMMRRRRRRDGGRRRKVKEREGKEGRRLKWILFNDFKMLIECNGRNVLSQVME